MNYSPLTTYRRHAYHSLPRGKDITEPINGNCNLPWTTMTVDTAGDITVCSCEPHLPISVGNVLDFETIEDIFNSPVAKIIQNDIKQRKFTWCAVKHCGVINEYVAGWGPTNIGINIDDSCNLACPSCRKEQYMESEGKQFDIKVKILERIALYLERYEGEINIKISGNGDCLASHIMRNFILTYKPKPNQKFIIITNGLLMKKVLPESFLIPNIRQYSISVDAGSAEVYEVVRQPGKWTNLISNLDWLNEIRGNTRVSLKFTLQNKNYSDIINFLNLCKQYNFFGEITSLVNWNTWALVTDPLDKFTVINGTWSENNVLDPRHPNFTKCMDMVEKSLSQLDIPERIKYDRNILNLLKSTKMNP